MSGETLVFYTIWGQLGDEEAHPNAFRVKYDGVQLAKDQLHASTRSNRFESATLPLRDVIDAFPLEAVAPFKGFHFTFRMNSRDGAFYTDVTNPNSIIPMCNDRFVARVVPLVAPAGEVIDERPVDSLSRESFDTDTELRSPYREEFSEDGENASREGDNESTQENLQSPVHRWEDDDRNSVSSWNSKGGYSKQQVQSAAKMAADATMEGAALAKNVMGSFFSAVSKKVQTAANQLK